ncbi:MAG: hypothetical protein GX621_05295 [Pirellulaceae bacterium]|nr:hypothetical protein [Pirellulaceae bacterium]
MSTVRLRRLHADHQKLVEFVMRHPRLRLIQAQGDPPELYQLEYCINSLRQTDEGLVPSKSHIAEIALPRDYPRTPPQCRMLTPIFHPNIAPHAICIGDHWAAGEPLWSMVARIGEMIAYQSYNTKSPLNGEAARWVEKNLERLPLDPVSMMIDEPATTAGATRPAAAPLPVVVPVAVPSAVAVAIPVAVPAAVSRTAAPAAPAPAAPSPAADSTATITVACPQCHTRYRVPAANAGKRACCKQCQTVFQISATK